MDDGGGVSHSFSCDGPEVRLSVEVMGSQTTELPGSVLGSMGGSGDPTYDLICWAGTLSH